MKSAILSLILISFFAPVWSQKVVHDRLAETRPVTAFHAIEVSNAIDVQLTQGGEHSLAVSAEKPEYRNEIITEVEDGVLKISYNERRWLNTGNKKLRAYVSFVNLDRISASGACDVNVIGELKSNDLSVKMSGASDLKGDLSAGSLKLNLSGASDVHISGEAKNLKITASGASSFKGYDLKTENCTANASGASDIRITVNKELNANASGASGVYYRGDAVIRDLRSSGASNVSRK